MLYFKCTKLNEKSKCKSNDSCWIISLANKTSKCLFTDFTYLIEKFVFYETEMENCQFNFSLGFAIALTLTFFFSFFIQNLKFKVQIVKQTPFWNRPHHSYFCIMWDVQFWVDYQNKALHTYNICFSVFWWKFVNK